MPELPEVQTVRMTLKEHILNKKIKTIDVFYPKMIENDLLEFKEKILNQNFIDIKRIGKWLIFELNDYYLLSHLRMEGKYFLKQIKDPIIKHEHVIFTFEDNQQLRYHDVRKFGKMKLIKKEELFSEKAIQKQGIEPLDKLLTKEYLIDEFSQKTSPIKTTLLDQRIISGLGNIYADEVLFHAGISPFRKTNTINIKEAQKIIDACKLVISKAIEKGGTTIRSYTSSLGVSGRFQTSLIVHQQVGKPCKICHTIIEKTKIGGRGTYYCKKCQK